MKLLLGIALLVSGCASIGSSQPPATLIFVSEARMGMPGGIVEIDGTANPPNNRAVMVAPGRRTIGYDCPDTITVDGPVTLEATFESGKTYELVCTGTQAAIRLK